MMYLNQYKNREDSGWERFHEALAFARDLTQIILKVDGVRDCKLGMGRGTIAMLIEVDNFAAVDAVLADPEVQSGFGKLLSDYGQVEHSQEFFYDLDQVAPFLAR